MGRVNGLTLGRRALLAAGAGAAAGLAGCSEEGTDRAEPGDPVAYTPASASVLVHADMALVESETTRRLVEAYAAEGGENLLESVESRTGVALESVDEVATFADRPRPDRGTLVVDAEVNESEVRSAVEERRGTDYEATDHDNGTVFTPAEGDGPAVGIVAEGQYVVGAESKVRAALDVFAGDAEGFGGPLRDAFETARGGSDDGDGSDGSDGSDDRRQYVTAATDRPREYLPGDDSERVPAGASLDLYGELETATATYAVVGERIAVDIDLRAPDEETAGRVEDFTGTILAFLRSDVEDSAVADELAQVALNREGAVVTVAYRSDVEGAATLAAWVAAAAES